MSLSSLHSRLDYYCGQRRYWQGSADEYSQRISKYSALVDDREQQLAIARAAEPKVTALASANSEARARLTDVGTEIDRCAGSENATSVMGRLVDPNDDSITSASEELRHLIEQLEGDLESYRGSLEESRVGKSYSESRVNYFSGKVSSTRYEIDTCHDNDN